MAYDDKELKINGDTYRRHEGRLELLTAVAVGAGEDEWFSYDTVDFFDDLEPCFKSFNTQFQLWMEDRWAVFNPKYTQQEWEQLFELALHETVVFTKSINNRFNFNTMKEYVIVYDSDLGIYVPMYNERCDKVDSLTELIKVCRLNINSSRFFLRIAHFFFHNELMELFKQKYELLEKFTNEGIMISGLENCSESLLFRQGRINDHYFIELDMLYSDLFEEWFDEEYIPGSSVIVDGFLQLEYDIELDRVIFNFFRIGKVWCYYCHDMDTLFNTLNIAVKDYENIKRIVNANIPVLKIAIQKLFENNFSDIWIKRSPVSEVVQNKHITLDSSSNPYYLSFEDIKHNPFVTSLKELDLRTNCIKSLTIKCKIKNLKAPVLDKRSNEYTQTCIVYDDNTNKTIKAVLTDSVADFDKWDNITDVEIWGAYHINKPRPLLIMEMKPIETDSTTNVVNRSQETPGYNEWRDAVIKRDKVCQCCGLDKHQEAHHIFGYKEHPELATDVNNGIVLCKFCHDKYHSIYGLKNINPRDLVEFIKDFGVVKK